MKKARTAKIKNEFINRVIWHDDRMMIFYNTDEIVKCEKTQDACRIGRRGKPNKCRKQEKLA